MKISDLTVEVRDKNLNRLGQIVAADLDILLEDQFNNVGSWSLKLATNHPLASALRTPGAGIIVLRSDGTTLLSGPTIKPEDAATATDPGGTLTVEGITDTVILADRLAFPDPTNVNPETQTLSHDVRTGPIETLMHAYVNANIGPSAPSARRDVRLQMGANLGRGPTLTKRARFPVIGNLLAELAITAGLGFRLVQVGSNLQFQTYAIANRTSEIRLDIANNTLAGHRVATAPPGVTRVIVAGQGEMVNRKFLALDTPQSIAAEAEWGRRIEKFVDQRQTNVDSELSQAGMEELAKNGFSQFSVQVVPMEDSSMTFGRDWGLGDRVSVVVAGSEVKSDVIGYVLRANRDGIKLGAILGDPVLQGSSSDHTLSKVETRVSNLERNAEAAPAGARYLKPADYTQTTVPIGYPQGESLMYLTDAQATAGAWDFAGKWGTLRSIHALGNGDVVQTWQRAHGNVTDQVALWQRAGNSTTGWSPWRQVAITSDVAAVDSRVTAVDNRVTAVDGRVNTTDSNVSALAGRVSAVEFKTDDLNIGWTPYTPFWISVTGVDPNPAAHFVSGRWRKVDDRLALVEWRIQGNSAGGWGTGVWAFGLPWNITNDSANMSMGSGYVLDAGVQDYACSVRPQSVNSVRMYHHLGSVGQGSYFTYGPGDLIIGSISVEPA